MRCPESRGKLLHSSFYLSFDPMSKGNESPTRYFGVFIRTIQAGPPPNRGGRFAKEIEMIDQAWNRILVATALWQIGPARW
jgi:hypothetical protein